jgi:hypothetical protein
VRLLGKRIAAGLLAVAAAKRHAERLAQAQ